MVAPAKPFDINDPSRHSVNLEYYVRILRDLGHDSVFYCPPESVCSPDIPVCHLTPSEYLDVSYWRQQQIDIAIMITSLKRAHLLHPLREAGIKVVNRADQSGDISFRVFPVAWWRYVMANAHTPLGKVRAIKNWMDSYVRGYKQQDPPRIASIEASHRVTIETETGRANLVKFLHHYRRSDLIDRLQVVPHLVNQTILTHSIPLKKKKIVAVGRWDEPQKDAPLMKATLATYLSKAPDTEVVLIGRCGKEYLGDLAKQYPYVTCTEVIPRSEVVNHLANAQVLVLTSRWESFHIAAHEALALGCTVVGPEVTPLPDIQRLGAFGQMVAGRRSENMAAGLAKEMRLWETGEREANRIGLFWRERLNPHRLVAEMVTL